MIQDSFFIASASSMALYSDFTKKLFVNVNESSSKFTFEMYAAGGTFEIIVDDTVPVFKPVES